MSLTTVAFLLAFMAGLVTAFSRHPIFGLMTYVGVFYLHPPSRWWGQALPDPGWAMIAAAVTMLAVIVHKNRNKVSLAPLFREKIVIGLIMFLVWILIQSTWALDQAFHSEFVALIFKYILLIVMMYICIDSEKHMRYFLWAHVMGCFYLGWIAFTSYGGGRFEGFGGPGIGDANTGGFQIVTGILTGAALFISGKKWDRIALFGLMPIIVNGLITTISRSGFLAAAVGGLVFNFFAPKQSRKLVRIVSVLGLVLFGLLTNDVYWTRMESLKQAGEQVEGVDTGTSRLVIINAQWQMFQKWPMGCGHRCTATLSSQYMDDVYLTGPPGNRSRSSHNTFMSLLVEQGVIGALMYFALAIWTAFKVFSVARVVRKTEGLLSSYFPAIAGVVVITIVGDLFVDYLKLEVRIWFIALLLIVERMARAEISAAKPVSSAVAAKRGAAANIPVAQPSGNQPRSHGMPRR
jgi:hypothetical protein